MRVALEGIKFNYAPDDLKKTGAFNLRRNETQIVRIPEWLPEEEAAPAAYAICALPAEMTIQASFNCEFDPGTSIRIRAIAEFTDHVLGDVEPVEITNSGSSGYITLRLPDARVTCVGVGIHDIGWRWQFFSEPQVWTDFETTRHRIYTVLARPSDPWEPKSTVDNIHQPWTEVLDFACDWATGAAGDLDQAAELLTKEFFKRVSKLVTYEKGASYAFSEFKCTSFLSLLKTGAGNQIVNCDDCATVVSTFANILGCQLSQSSLGISFKTNPVVPIGSRNFTRKGFRYHSVAWKGQCLEDDELFDGCLQIDKDVAPPLIPVQPTNLSFGNEKEGYKFSLVCNSPHCHPIPDHPIYGRRRRKLGKGYLADAPITDEELLSELKRDFVFDSWPKSKEEPLQETVSDKGLTSILEQFSLIGWEVQSGGDHFKDDRFQNVYEQLFKRADFSEEKLVALTVYQCKDTADPNHNLLEILGRFEELDFKRMVGSKIGDVAFVDNDGTTIVFRRARMLAVVRSAGKQPVPIIGNAEIVAHGLTDMSGESNDSQTNDN